MASEAYDLGVKRGRSTGRSEPTDRDWQWLADETDGRVQTDPDDCNDFAYGMRAGAAEPDEDPRAVGKPFGYYVFRGRPCAVAAGVGLAVGYADEGKSGPATETFVEERPGGFSGGEDIARGTRGTRDVLESGVRRMERAMGMKKSGKATRQAALQDDLVRLIKVHGVEALLEAICAGAEACGEHDGIDAYDTMASHLYDAVESYKDAVSFANLPRTEEEGAVMPLVDGIMAAREKS